MKKVITSLAAVSVTAIILLFTSAVLYAENPRASFFSQELDCSVIELESYEAMPMTNIAITGIPEDYEGLIGAEILNGGEVTGMVLADQYSDGSWYLISPVNPEFSNEGTTVTLRMVDEDVTCDPFEFEISPMPIDPLDLDAYMDNFEEVIELFASHRGYTIDELIQMDEQTAETNLQAAIFMSKMVRGVDGYTDLRAMMSRENLGGDLNDEDWNLLMTLYGRVFSQPDTTTGVQIIPSDANSDIRGQSGFNLENQPDYTKWASAEIPGTSRPWEYGSEASSQLDYCSLMYPVQTAEVLEGYLKSYRAYERRINTLQLTQRQSQSLIIGLTVLGAIATGGTAATIGLATATTGAAFSITGFLLEFGRALYPNKIHDFYVASFGPDRFMEDEPDLTGSWENAFISASSDSFDFGSEGMRAIWGTVEGFVMNRVPGSSQAHERVASEAGKALVSDTIDDMLQNLPGTRQIPACNIGPVDISDEKYTRFYSHSNPGVVQITGHQVFEVIGVERAELVVCALETLVRDVDRSPFCLFYERFQVNVSRISVHIVRSDAPNVRGRIFVEPREVVELVSMVQNANDETVGWSIDPPGNHSLTPHGIGEEATLIVSDNEDDFPFFITAQSLSFTGLREDPNAPPREDTRIVTVAEPEEDMEVYDCRGDHPIRLSDLTPCSFIAHMHGPNIAYEGKPDFHATSCFEGSISGGTVNRHGVYNMTWNGRSEDRTLNRVIVQLIPPSDDQSTYETEGVGFGGGLTIGYDAHVRGGSGTMPTYALYTFDTEERSIKIYPLADTDLWAGTFDMEVRTNPGSQARRDAGNQNLNGVFILGEACMWPEPEE